MVTREFLHNIRKITCEDIFLNVLDCHQLLGRVHGQVDCAETSLSQNLDLFELAQYRLLVKILPLRNIYYIVVF